jgi:hypothetical protein
MRVAETDPLADTSGTDGSTSALSTARVSEWVPLRFSESGAASTAVAGGHAEHSGNVSGNLHGRTVDGTGTVNGEEVNIADAGSHVRVWRR